LEVSDISRIFAPSKVKAMEKKKYPLFEEEESTGMVSEPLAAPVPDELITTYGIAEVQGRIDDQDWDKFPSYGPFSEEEAIARIEEAEKDLADPSKWITIDDLHAELKNLHPWLQ